MAVYKVKPNQNIWDVAIHLYGSIEGIFDLLISNEKLSVNDDLVAGMELNYHEYFKVNEGIVSCMEERNLIPANGERHIYPKQTDEPLRFIYETNPIDKYTEFVVAGDGVMVVDWGDNSELESIILSHTNTVHTHYFDSEVDKRVIKVYGDFSLIYIDLTKLGGAILPVAPLLVDEVTSHSNSFSLKGLFLFKGTYKVDLTYMRISDLMPIADMNLQELNLIHARFESVSVLDDYLVYIASPEHHGTRRNCKVYLTQEPSSVGMAAIETIINEDSWNESGQWEFNINGRIYKKE